MNFIDSLGLKPIKHKPEQFFKLKNGKMYKIICECKNDIFLEHNENCEDWLECIKCHRKRTINRDD